MPFFSNDSSNTTESDATDSPSDRLQALSMNLRQDDSGNAFYPPLQTNDAARSAVPDLQINYGRESSQSDFRTALHPSMQQAVRELPGLDRGALKGVMTPGANDTPAMLMARNTIDQILRPDRNQSVAVSAEAAAEAARHVGTPFGDYMLASGNRTSDEARDFFRRSPEEIRAVADLFNSERNNAGGRNLMEMLNSSDANTRAAGRAYVGQVRGEPQQADRASTLLNRYSAQDLTHLSGDSALSRWASEPAHHTRDDRERVGRIIRDSQSPDPLTRLHASLTRERLLQRRASP
jgi:hypothetical protein